MANGNNRLNMGPYESEQSIENPQTNEEVFLGSFSSILQNNLGAYVRCEFLIGTNMLEAKEGILYTGGNNFITLYQPSQEQYIVCDLYSLKFVTFFNSADVPSSALTDPNIRLSSQGQSYSPPGYQQPTKLNMGGNRPMR